MVNTIYIAGDSTAAIKEPETRPETGWGECLQSFFDPQKIKVIDTAQNGRSTKSFISENRLAAIEQTIKPGDYLFIQFGHNDQKLEDPDRGTFPYDDYQANLRQFVDVARQHQATPVLLTSFTRRKYLAGTEKIDPNTLGDYPAAMRQLATKEHVLLLDLNTISRDFLNQHSITETKKYFLHLKPGAFPNYPEGRIDDTHSSPLGAQTNAKMVVQAIQNSNLELSYALITKNK